MHHFMLRAATAVLVVSLAFAISANAQAPSSSSTNNNSPNVQTNVSAATPPATTTAPAAGSAPAAVTAPRTTTTPVAPRAQAVQPGATQRTRTVQQQPGVQVQPATPGSTARVRTGVRDTAIPANQGDFATRTTLPNQQFPHQRTVFRPSEMRGPDLGFWFTRPVRDGLVISDIGTVGPIARLGFREGDRIVSVNGTPITTERQFIDLLAADTLNPAQVVVFRNGVNETITVDPTFLAQQQAFVEDVAPLEQFGVVLDDRFNDRVVVWRVLPGTPAFYAGFRPGDVVTTLSGQPFRTRADFENAIVGLQPGEIPVRVMRGPRARDLMVDVPQFRTALRPGESIGDRVDKREVLRDEVKSEGVQPQKENPDQRPYLQNVPRTERR